MGNSRKAKATTDTADAIRTMTPTSEIGTPIPEDVLPPRTSPKRDLTAVPVATPEPVEGVPSRTRATRATPSAAPGKPEPTIADATAIPAVADAPLSMRRSLADLADVCAKLIARQDRLETAFATLTQVDTPIPPTLAADALATHSASKGKRATKATAKPAAAPKVEATTSTEAERVRDANVAAGRTMTSARFACTHDGCGFHSYNPNPATSHATKTGHMMGGV